MDLNEEQIQKDIDKVFERRYSIKKVIDSEVLSNIFFLVYRLSTNHKKQSYNDKLAREYMPNLNISHRKSSINKGISPKVMAQHLRKLREAGFIVANEKEGRFQFYDINIEMLALTMMYYDGEYIFVGDKFKRGRHTPFYLSQKLAVPFNSEKNDKAKLVAKSKPEYHIVIKEALVNTFIPTFLNSILKSMDNKNETYEYIPQISEFLYQLSDLLFEELPKYYKEEIGNMASIVDDDPFFEALLNLDEESEALIWFMISEGREREVVKAFEGRIGAQGKIKELDELYRETYLETRFK